MESFKTFFERINQIHKRSISTVDNIYILMISISFRVYGVHSV